MFSREEGRIAAIGMTVITVAVGLGVSVLMLVQATCTDEVLPLDGGRCPVGAHVVVEDLDGAERFVCRCEQDPTP